MKSKKENLNETCSYDGVELEKTEVLILKDLEQIIGEKIPQKKKAGIYNTGFSSKDNEVVYLSQRKNVKEVNS